LLLVAIKKGKRRLHQTLMTSAIALSIAFLVMYVAYHMTSDSTKFGGEGVIVCILFYIIHAISLSVIIIPLVLVTYVRAWAQVFDKHKKNSSLLFQSGYMLLLQVLSFI
jgi:putative membrane protein